MRVVVVALWAGGAGAAHAHGSAGWGGGAQWPIWLAQALFCLAWFSYTAGAVRKRPGVTQRAVFHAGMLLAGVALFGPLDGWADSSTAWHMVQHMLLIAVVAPLLVLARPLAQWRAAWGRGLDPVWRAVLRLARQPLGCAMLHAAAVWIWHAPGPYLAAVQSNGWHVLEHASFLCTGWLFWWAVLRPARSGALQAVLALLVTVMHTGMLGALLTFARVPLYGSESRELWDQQLAGLVMWIPGGAVYLAAAAWAGYRWLAQREHRPPGTDGPAAPLRR